MLSFVLDAGSRLSEVREAERSILDQFGRQLLLKGCLSEREQIFLVVSS